MIEEPEIHLHPKAQADLASSASLKTRQSELANSIIFTTHSEHVVGRLLTLVAEGTLAADELAIYEKDDKGVCSASEIEVTDRGQVTGD